ncbi:MAG: mechanosensitive ion channel family protein [Gammaproteobacteria bacterium]
MENDPAVATAPPITMEQLIAVLNTAIDNIGGWVQGPGFLVQLALAVAAVLLAFVAARPVARLLRVPDAAAEVSTLLRLRHWLSRLRPVVFPLLAVGLLNAAARYCEARYGEGYALRIVESLLVIRLAYAANREFATSHMARRFIAWVLIPIAVLYLFNWLGPVVGYLESVKLTSGNISLSLYTILRVLIFGTILFWLGRKSNDTGKQYIRQQKDLDVGTREVFAKLFEIGLFFVIFVLLLQVMGINLTTLAVFGGALGVGLGFGLQSIASNFVSGLILLLDRSLTVGDYVELEDGRAGIIRELTMRCAILKTFDGKDVVVPNETFVTSSFTNWTHENKKQRYAIEFQVAYSTDMEPMLDVLKEVVASHPQVLSGDQASLEEQPDAEISGFGDSGVNILIEYWMEGIDDGRNRVDADLNMMIWKALKESGVAMPFPQREVRIIGQGAPIAK